MITNTDRGTEFLTQNTCDLTEPRGPKSLATCAERAAKENIEIGWAIPQWPQWRQAAHNVKAHVLDNLDTLLTQFVAQLEAKGVTVLWAKDAAEANRLVLRIADENKVRTVVKAKSMVSEEIGLNHALESHGIRAVETDLGEYIVQLAGQRPTHIVMPALHLSAAEIGQLFADKLGEEYTAEHQKLTMIARKRLRQMFLEADMGISGANFGIAETGTLVLLENEGNIGLSTSLPKIHVALVGIEKMLPSLEYLPLFLNMLPRMGTGQKLTTYTHLIHGPVVGRQLVVILIDNGRTEVLSQGQHRKVLHCIRCGLCMNHCPVYREVGGWAYGWVYPGPLGAVLTPLLVGMKKAGQLPFACTLCGACSEICPVKIDLAHQLVRLRRTSIQSRSSARKISDVLMWRIFAKMMSSSARYRFLMRSVRFGIRMAPLLPVHPWLLGAWTRGRAVPKLPDKCWKDEPR